MIPSPIACPSSMLAHLRHTASDGKTAPRPLRCPWVGRGGWSLLLCVALSLPGTGWGGEPMPQAPQGEAAKASKSASSAPRPGQDWPQFLGPCSDGSSAETGLDPTLWQPLPPVVWTLPLGTSYGAPTIHAGRLYQFDRIGAAERLTCYTPETAEELWRWESQVEYDDMFGYNNGPRCSPLADDDRIYLYGVNGQLSCVSADTGKLRWTKNLNNEYDVVPNFFGVASNPVIYQNLLLVMVGGSTPETRYLPTERLNQVEPNGSAIVAFDKHSGREVYRLGNDLASYSSLLVKPIEGKPMGLAFLRNSLIGFDPASGQQRFRFPWRANMLESVNAAMPVVDGNRILISEAYEVGSALLEIENDVPQVVWQDGGPRSRCRFRAHWSTPALVDGFLYGCSGRNGPDTDFRCVRFSDGEVQWTDRNRERQRSSVLRVDGYLIVLGENGRLELLKPNPQEPKILAAIELSELTTAAGAPLLDYPCWAAPVLSHGRLYVRGKRHLVCLELLP